MKIFNQFSKLLFVAAAAVSLCACEKDNGGGKPSGDGRYVMAMIVSGSTGGSAYYIVDTDNLMSGTISAEGNGIEHSGYHEYQKFDNTVLAIGGRGVLEIRGVVRDAQDKIQMKSNNFVFNYAISEIVQVADDKFVAVSLPLLSSGSTVMTLYEGQISTLSILQTKTIDVSDLITQAPLAEGNNVWPVTTGIGFNNGKIFLSYYEANYVNNSNSNTTPWTDNGQIAVISYPDMEFESVIKDTRTGPIGSWNAHVGIIEAENGDLYLMSNSSMTNGYTQNTKVPSFTRIKDGETTFDDSYYFEFNSTVGGERPAHVMYIGDGLVFAEVCTNTSPESGDRWADKPLKCCIIDLNNKTVTDVAGIPAHDGSGGRNFTAMVDGGQVYIPIPTENGIYVYKVDPATATAQKGARVSASYAVGLFYLD